MNENLLPPQELQRRWQPLKYIWVEKYLQQWIYNPCLIYKGKQKWIIKVDVIENMFWN